MREVPIASSQCGLTIQHLRIRSYCKFTILYRKLWLSKVYIISIIYGAHWKSHECPSRDLSISALERYLCDENIMAPTIVWSLHAFLTLVHKSRPSTSFIYQHLCALYETPGCTYRLIHVVEGLVCLNKCSVLWQHLSKNLQSLGRKKILSKIMECQNIEWSSTRRELVNIFQ